MMVYVVTECWCEDETPVAAYATRAAAEARLELYRRDHASEYGAVIYELELDKDPPRRLMLYSGATANIATGEITPGVRRTEKKRVDGKKQTITTWDLGPWWFWDTQHEDPDIKPRLFYDFWIDNEHVLYAHDQDAANARAQMFLEAIQRGIAEGAVRRDDGKRASRPWCILRSNPGEQIPL